MPSLNGRTAVVGNLVLVAALAWACDASQPDPGSKGRGDSTENDGLVATADSANRTCLLMRVVPATDR